MELKTFKTKLATVVKSEATLRDNIQSLAISAVDTFAQHGDTSRIEMLVNASVVMRSVRSNTLKDFIKAHANVKFTPNQNQDGFIVKKIGKGPVEVKPIESDWFDFNNEGVAKEKVALAIIKAALSSIDKAQEKGTLKTMVSAEEKLVAQLRAALAA